MTLPILTPTDAKAYAATISATCGSDEVRALIALELLDAIHPIITDIGVDITHDEATHATAALLKEYARQSAEYAAYLAGERPDPRD